MSQTVFIFIEISKSAIISEIFHNKMFFFFTSNCFNSELFEFSFALFS